MIIFERARPRCSFEDAHLSVFAESRRTPRKLPALTPKMLTPKVRTHFRLLCWDQIHLPCHRSVAGKTPDPSAFKSSLLGDDTEIVLGAAHGRPTTRRFRIRLDLTIFQTHEDMDILIFLPHIVLKSRNQPSRFFGQRFPSFSFVQI